MKLVMTEDAKWHPEPDGHFQNKKTILNRMAIKNGIPMGIRTPVAGMRTLCPRPLDDGDASRIN